MTHLYIKMIEKNILMKIYLNSKENKFFLFILLHFSFEFISKKNGKKINC